MNNLDKPAFARPSWPSAIGGAQDGMTIRQHAAITLRVPMSGDPELDAMIREARRLDMATAAMQGACTNPASLQHTSEGLANTAFNDADALLAASEPNHIQQALAEEVWAKEAAAFSEPKKAEPEREHEIVPTWPQCSARPDAPHGFDRNASHGSGRYVCTCEGWQPDAEGWIEWGGDYKQPVPADMAVDVKFRNGATSNGKIADTWEWDHADLKSDIIAYRIVKEEK